MRDSGNEGLLGRRCIEVAGPRTRDVVQLARSAWRCWSKDLGVEDLVESAFRDVVADEDVIAHTLWKGLTLISRMFCGPLWEPRQDRW
jgi:hypothetical protein